MIKESDSSQKEEEYTQPQGLEGRCAAHSGVSVLFGTRPGGGSGAGGDGLGAGRCGKDPVRVISQHLHNGRKSVPGPIQGSVSCHLGGLPLVFSIADAHMMLWWKLLMCDPSPQSPSLPLSPCLHQVHQHPSKDPRDDLIASLPSSHVWSQRVLSVFPQTLPDPRV